MSNETQAEMPRYKCHKEVHALKLDAVRHGHSKDGQRQFNTCVLYPADKAFDPIEVDGPWCCEKINIENDDCGYLVVYADGYKSWSPTKAFEDGYTRL
jgi:hypothetical protein